jgi:probable addiction module antidote protein
MSKTKSYRESLFEALSDPKEAAAYLNAGLEDSIEAFLKALKNVAQANQMTRVAKGAGVHRETLYRALSEQGNPTTATLLGVLSAVGLQVEITAVKKEEIDSSPPIQVLGSGMKEQEIASRISYAATIWPGGYICNPNHSRDNFGPLRIAMPMTVQPVHNEWSRGEKSEHSN